MKIQSLTICGFRCFANPGQTIQLDDFTCFVGPNASGKTSAMLALARLFGDSRTQRQIVPSDFHLRPGERLKDSSSRTLVIECRLVFPELATEQSANSLAIPEAFNQMIIDEPGGIPYCRIRLNATWADDGTAEGDIEQSLSWVLTPLNDQAVINENSRRIQPGDRGMIRVIYVPATRDPAKQVRATAGTSFGRLLEGLALQEKDEILRGKLGEIHNIVSQLTGVQIMNNQIQESWNKLYQGRIANNVELQAIEEEPASLVKLIAPVFKPGEDEHVLSVNDLSDGLRSLFSLSLSLGLFRTECFICEKISECGFKEKVTQGLSALTIFAIEEPENHLSPHYLGQVIAELMTLSVGIGSQIMISSHSPSILGRVKPDRVRYFLGHEETASTTIKSVPLPTDQSDESYKYVREAVRGYPELYFSKLVVLGEGASEEIVLRRIFEASGVPLDRQFISVVPLGGRHVNHFWRLLNGLEIPFITLLDLDHEKEGAGWGRIQYIRNQLVKRFEGNIPELTTKFENGCIFDLSDSRFDVLYTYNVTDTENMKKWLNFLANRYGIFFSEPLDLDFSMLEAFPNVYKGLAPNTGGPRIPDHSDPKFKEVIVQRMRQVLATDAKTAPTTLGSTYIDNQQELFAWYKYLFIDRSKPVAHMRALVKLTDEELKASAPETLKKLVEYATTKIASTKERANE